MLSKFSLVTAFVVLGGSASISLGQSEPPNVIDLGIVQVGGVPTRTQPIAIAAGQTRWFKFRLSQPVDYKSSWLDLNTTGSSIPTNMAIYNWRAYFIASNIDFAGGGNSSGISIGSGSGKRLGDVGDANPTGRISYGQNIEANNGFVPYIGAERVHYVAVVGAGADFSQSPNPNWQISTPSTTAGTIRLQVAAGFQPSSRWNEAWNGIDAGNELQTAAVPVGKGALTQILTASLPAGKDMFKIRVCDPAQFRVTATPTRDAGGLSPVRLFIFDAQGRGVAAINNTIFGTLTTLTLPPGSAAGDYYVAWSNFCAGVTSLGRQNSAYDENNQVIFDFSLSSSWNVRLSPNGPGAANPLASWGDAQICDGSQAYWLSLDLVGACYVQQPCDDIDFNNNDVFPEEQDVIDFFNVLAGGTCP